MRFAPALWPSCTSHHAVLSARHPSIHPPCQYPLPVFSSPSISWPHHHSSPSSSSSFMLKRFLFAFCAPYFPFISPTNRLILSTLVFFVSPPSSHPFIRPSFPPILYHPFSHPTPPFPLTVCTDRFCGSRAGCVNVKPFPAMIMFITRCVSRCPWINTNWRSTLQR